MARLVEGDDPALVVVERAARLHAGHHALERGVEVAVHDHVAVLAGGEDRRLVAEVREVGAGQAGGLARDQGEVDVRPAACRACARRMICSRPATSGGETKIWRSKRPGRSSAGSSFSSRLEAAMTTRSFGRLEAVHLDQQLVERLLALGVVVRAALAADGVDLVDEDDRRALLARHREQPPDAGGAEAGEHLDERGGRLREEVRARLVGDGLGQQRLAGAGRPVQQDAAAGPSRRAS